VSSDDVPQRGQHPALSRQPEPTPRSSLPTSPPPYPQLAIAALAADPVIERLRAEVERLRRWKAEANTVLKNWDCWAEQAIALLDAIDALHHPVPSGKGDEVCNDCAFFWPCRTHLLLHPEGGPS